MGRSGITPPPGRSAAHAAPEGAQGEPDETDDDTQPPANGVPTRMARQLALAHYVDRMIRSGQVSGDAEAAINLGVTRARASQILNLLLLAPDIQEGLLTGRIVAGERVVRTVLFEPDWDEQRRMLADAALGELPQPSSP